MADEPTQQDQQAPTSDATQNTETPGPASGKTFSQDELDKIIARRLERAKKDWQEELEQERKQAAMTAEEKLKAELAAERERSQQALASANQRAIRAEATAQASALGIRPERITYALKLADLSEIEVDDAGEPDSGAIKAALEAVIGAIPELKGATGNVGSGSNPTGGGTTGKIDPSQLSAKELAELQARVLRGERITL